MLTRRKDLYGLLGDLPDGCSPLSVLSRGLEEREAYCIERLLLDLNGVEPVPAFFVKPRNANGRKLPVVLFNHSHGGAYARGKRELLEGAPYLQDPPYAEELTRRGYAALCIDHWCFGERAHRSEADTFKQALWEGRVLWGMMVHDSLMAIDYLTTRDDVDGRCIATLGMSMGSIMAWWLAALDTRIRVCIDICCMGDFQALLERNALAGHGLYFFVPGLLRHFTTAQINALIAPRPHLSLAGNRDPLTPPEGLDRIDAELRTLYRRCGAPNAWQMARYDCGHEELASMRAAAMTFLETWMPARGEHHVVST